MKSSVSGLLWCLRFVVLDAGQAAFFGRSLQSFDSFLVGGLVFGSTAIVALLVSIFRSPDQMRIALAHPVKLLVLNLSVAGAWACYLLALQRIEPAICFAIFAGLVPLTTIVLHRFGVRAASGVASKWEGVGHLIAAAGLLVAIIITQSGQSGFTRGDAFDSAVGLGLTVAAGVMITIMLLSNRSLDEDGVGPLAQYGLRFPIYIVLCGGAWYFGLDAKEEADTTGLILVLSVGLVLLAFPIYAVQRAVAEVDALTIGALAATTPALVWVFQLADSRVDASVSTLAALGLFYVGALLAAFSRVRAPVRP